MCVFGRDDILLPLFGRTVKGLVGNSLIRWLKKEKRLNFAGK